MLTVGIPNMCLKPVGLPRFHLIALVVTRQLIKFPVIGCFIHSGYFYSTSSSSLLLSSRSSRHSMDTVSEFLTKAPQATASERLAQGPYVSAKAGFGTATLRPRDAESTNEPPRFSNSYNISS